MKDFENKPDFARKRLVQTLIPKIILHPDDKIELKINAAPKVLPMSPERTKMKWRGRVDEFRTWCYEIPNVLSPYLMENPLGLLVVGEL